MPVEFDAAICSFWCGSHPLTPLVTKLSKKIPPKGEAKEDHIEAFRCISRLYYDLYNNGMCNFERGNYLSKLATKLRAHNKKYIKSEKVPEAIDLIRKHGTRLCTDDWRVKELEPVLESAVEDVVLYCADIDGLKVPTVKCWETETEIRKHDAGFEDPVSDPVEGKYSFGGLFYYEDLYHVDLYSDDFSINFTGVYYEDDGDVSYASLYVSDLVLDLEDENGYVLHTFHLDHRSPVHG